MALLSYESFEVIQVLLLIPGFTSVGYQCKLKYQILHRFSAQQTGERNFWSSSADFVNGFNKVEIPKFKKFTLSMDLQKFGSIIQSDLKSRLSSRFSITTSPHCICEIEFSSSPINAEILSEFNPSSSYS